MLLKMPVNERSHGPGAASLHFPTIGKHPAQKRYWWTGWTAARLPAILAAAFALALARDVKEKTVTIVSARPVTF
jgi:hypothetical protein